MDPMLEYALAYALTTAAGVRALLALTALSIAAHLSIVHPPAGFEWLASTAATWVLGSLAALEILADKVPLLDHALHVVQIVVKPAAGAILVAGTLHPPSHELLLVLAVAGALNALGIHAAVATLRGASTIATGGLANPAVSTAEDVGSAGSLALAFVAPLVAAVLAALFTLAVVVAIRAAYRRLRSGGHPGAVEAAPAQRLHS